MHCDRRPTMMDGVGREVVEVAKNRACLEVGFGRIMSDSYTGTRGSTINSSGERGMDIVYSYEQCLLLLCCFFEQSYDKSTSVQQSIGQQ